MWMLANGFAHCGNTTRGGNRNYIVVVPEARIDRAQLAILAFKDNHNRVLISVAGGIFAVLESMLKHPQHAIVSHWHLVVTVSLRSPQYGCQHRARGDTFQRTAIPTKSLWVQLPQAVGFRGKDQIS
mmetsp:Transcript_17404/g.26591  ORF Transcript_17404/g.26591 Transcript_17404/m.26591 type:complete len:127 (-) Transcript_17404:750-1130(-)